MLDRSLSFLYFLVIFVRAGWKWKRKTGLSILPIEMPQKFHPEKESQEIEVDEGVSASSGQRDGGGEF